MCLYTNLHIRYTFLSTVLSLVYVSAKTFGHPVAVYLLFSLYAFGQNKEPSIIITHRCHQLGVHPIYLPHPARSLPIHQPKCGASSPLYLPHPARSLPNHLSNAYCGSPSPLLFPRLRVGGCCSDFVAIFFKTLKPELSGPSSQICLEVVRRRTVRIFYFRHR